MAVIGTAFNAVALYGMEYHQTSHPFLQGTNTPGTVDASVLGTSFGELGQINSLPMGSGLNSNGSYNMHDQLGVNPTQVGENNGSFPGVAAESQSPAGISAMSLITCTSQPGRLRKHKLQEGDDDCPSKKRRVSQSPTPLLFPGSQGLGIFAGGSGQPFWASSHSQVKEASIIARVTDQASSMMLPVSTEDMEEVAVESQSDVALRRIRDIESRLIVEDEEEEEDKSRENHLPTLVMSDVLVEGFKMGLNEALTKKIVDSINRPSMELVLWKPQPEFLVNKLKSISRSYKTDKVAKKIQRTPVMPIFQEVNPSDVDKPCNSDVDCNINTIWDRGEEEEMEL